MCWIDVDAMGSLAIWLIYHPPNTPADALLELLQACIQLAIGKPQVISSS